MYTDVAEKADRGGSRGGAVGMLSQHRTASLVTSGLMPFSGSWAHVEAAITQSCE